MVVEDAGRARLWGSVCQVWTLPWTLCRESHEYLDLSADMRLTHQNAPQEKGWIVEAVRLKVRLGEGPSGSHCSGPGGAGRPELGSTRGSWVRICPGASWVQLLQRTLTACIYTSTGWFAELNLLQVSQDPISKPSRLHNYRAELTTGQ